MDNSKQPVRRFSLRISAIQEIRKQHTSIFQTAGRFLTNLQPSPNHEISNLTKVRLEGSSVILGTGTFATVFLVKSTKSDSLFAIKEVTN